MRQVNPNPNLVDFLTAAKIGYLKRLVNFVMTFLTPEPNGVGEGVYGIGRVLRCRRRRRRRRDGFSVGTP